MSEDAVTKALMAHVGAHTINGHWLMMPHDGKLLAVKESPGAGGFVPETHKVYAAGMCQRLNKEIALDGRWLVGWTGFDLKEGWPRTLVFVWADGDGDIQFVVECEDRLSVMVFSEDDYMQQCLDAWAQWKEHERRLEVRASQKKRFALGERSEDPRAMPDFVPTH